MSWDAFFLYFKRIIKMTNDTIISLIAGILLPVGASIFKLFFDVADTKKTSSQLHTQLDILRTELEAMKNKNAKNETRIEVMRTEIHSINTSILDIKEDQKGIRQDQQEIKTMLVTLSSKML